MMRAALEIFGTSSTRGFLVRTTSEDALMHLMTQLRARYPQMACDLLPHEDDPFQVRTGETLSVVELQLGSDPYEPLQAMHHRDAHRQKGHDPLLGLLAALDLLPPSLRAITQLVIVPAPPDWSRRYQRKAMEHPLASERQQARQRPPWVSFPMVFAGWISLLLLLYQQQRLPALFQQTLQEMVQGKMAVFTFFPYGWALALLAAVPVGLMLLLHLARRHLWSPRLYDQQLVSAQTAQMAYRARLRLYVIGPGTSWTWSLLIGGLVRRVCKLAGACWRAYRSWGRHWRTWWHRSDAQAGLWHSKEHRHRWRTTPVWHRLSVGGRLLRWALLWFLQAAGHGRRQRLQAG
ncbi:MAG: hypothetical protein J2P37_36365, partial [Ktedonobacteraceae bacterium]|nr:hypothetical protein [Ktedonobacteraceae bacterium]